MNTQSTQWSCYCSSSIYQSVVRIKGGANTSSRTDCVNGINKVRRSFTWRSTYFIQAFANNRTTQETLVLISLTTYEGNSISSLTIGELKAWKPSEHKNFDKFEDCRDSTKPKFECLISSEYEFRNPTEENLWRYSLEFQVILTSKYCWVILMRGLRLN